MDADILVRKTIENELSREHLQLPIPDYIAGILSRLLRDDGVDFEELAGVITKDPSLVAKILNLSNSSFYSGLVRIRTVEQAITRIGLRAVKNLLMTVIFKNVFRTEHNFLRKEFEINWQHSLGCGICARRIAEQTSLAFLAEDAYLLGLLHDIGTVLILNSISELRSKMHDTALTTELVMGVVASLHAATGARILSRLGFNPQMCALVGLHHEPDKFENQNDTLFNILQLADRLLGKSGIALSHENLLSLDDAPWMARLNIDGQAVAEIETAIIELLAATDNLL